MRFFDFTFCTLFSIILIIKSSNEYRILGLFPSSVRSHFIMFEKLMKGLARKGHQIEVISHFPLKEQIKNYKDISIRGSLFMTENNLTYDNFFEPMNNIFWAKEIAMAGNMYCDNLKSLPLQKATNKSSQKYDLLVTELFASPCYFALGLHLKIPIVVMSSNALFDFMNDPFGNPMNPSFVPSSLVSYSQKMNFWQRIVNRISTVFMKRVFNYYIRTQDKQVENYFGKGYPSVYDVQKNVALVLVNSHFILNGIRPTSPSVIEVGGMHIEDPGEKLPQEIQEWLDESKHGCIYVAFGSMVTIESFPREFLNAFYTTFKNIAPVRVLMKIANDAQLPPGLPANVKTFFWISQIEVLKHENTRAFVTHGGLMGTMESIYCEVPMIGIPLYADQYTNIYHYERLKIATLIKIDAVNSDNFTSAVKTVLSDPTYRKNIKKISKLFMDRPNSPLETAIFWVEFVCRNGNLLKSPASDLEWWQVELLDVYGFILFVILITLYTFYSLLKILIRFFIRFKTYENNILENAKKNL